MLDVSKSDDTSKELVVARMQSFTADGRIDFMILMFGFGTLHLVTTDIFPFIPAIIPADALLGSPGPLVHSIFSFLHASCK